MRWFDVRWFVKALRQYADFSGRAQRAEFWMYTLVVVVIAVALAVVDESVLGYGVETSQPLPIGGQGPLGWLFGFATLIPTVAVTARRLHDIDRSGWWQLLTAPGVVVTLPWQQSMVTFIVLAITLIVGILGGIILLLMLIADGAAASNQWGANPKSGADGADPAGGSPSAGPGSDT